MRVVVQRVSEASVSVDGTVCARIGPGLLILVGIETGDGEADIGWLCGKLVRMRIFNDEDGKMNRSLQDIAGEALAISQFTLHASTKKGNRPGFTRAAPPEISRPLYRKFLEELRRLLGRPVAEGQFGAMMKVQLINDGPVTILMDSRDRE